MNVDLATIQIAFAQAMTRDPDLAAEYGDARVVQNGHPSRRDTVLFEPWAGEARVTQADGIFQVETCEDIVAVYQGADLAAILVDFLWSFI